MPHFFSHSKRYEGGYVLVMTLVFLGVLFTISTAYLSFVTSSTRSVRTDVANAQALSLAEAGIDKAAYQLNQSGSYTGETNTAIGAGTFTVTVSTVNGSTKQITAIGSVPNSTNPIATRTVKARVGIDNSIISFHYGIQSGQGGFTLSDNSLIHGNVYSSGSVIGSSANDIYGDVVSSGASGLVYGIHSTGSVYAHSIGKDDSTTIIGKDAYYVTKTHTTVNGISHPNNPDQPVADLPISDAQIAEWETEAVAGGIATCTNGNYSITSTVTIGPKKIPCDLNISGNAIVTIAGHIWVTGNITVQNNAVIKMASALGATNVAIIADNPADRINSSKWSVQNNAAFQNSGTAGSFVFLISQNNSAENGGRVVAITLSNNATSLVAYAAHGLIPLSNNVALKEVTAYTIALQNNAIVTYDSGLPSAVFESGPGGSWAFVPGSYAITQ